MIDIPVKTEVQCSDGDAGLSTYVIVNPINNLITHLVVKSSEEPFKEYKVPVDQIEETTPNLIKLKCTRDDLDKMDPFISEEYIHTNVPDFEGYQDDYLAWPYVLPPPGFVYDSEDGYIPLELENMPEGELAVSRGAQVEATDGYVGQVDELLINSSNMHITHLVLRERHIFKDREITIPVSQIDHVDEDTIYLKLDLQGVEDLPTTPIQRWEL